jgi:hypothetical protein
LRQGLVDGVQRYCPGNARVDIDIQLRVPRQREKQFLDADVLHHDAVGFGPRNLLRLGRHD